MIEEDLTTNDGPGANEDDGDDVEQVSFGQVLLFALHEESSVVDGAEPRWDHENSHDDLVNKQIHWDALVVKEEAGIKNDGEETRDSIEALDTTEEPHS